MTRRTFNHFSIESLERREMMAADVALAGGVLNIVGTEMDDQVVVSQVDNQVQVTITDAASGKTLAKQSFAASAVKHINVECLGGDDVAVNDTNIPSTMNGGAGDDLLVGGAARDVVFGEMGNDEIWDAGEPDMLASKENLIQGFAEPDLAGGQVKGLAGLGLGSGRITSLAGLGLGSGRLW